MPISTNASANSGSLAETLTRSELQCLRLTAEGESIAAIARKLSMTEQEIETLLFCAERKLNAENRLHAICLAAAMNLLANRN